MTAPGVPPPSRRLPIGMGLVLGLFLLAAATAFGLFSFGLRRFERHANAQRRAALAEKVSMAHGALQPILQELHEGRVARETALEAARTRIRTLVHADEFGQNYIFMNGMDGRVLVRPYRPQDELKPDFEFRDARGVAVFREVIPRLREHPEGVYFAYHFPNPRTGLPEEKLAFFLLVPELDVMLGTGAYLGSAQKAQVALLRSGFAVFVALLALFALPTALALRGMSARARSLAGEVQERRRAEQRLQEGLDDLRVTLDAIGDAVISTDLDGRVVRMNPVAEALTGCPAPEALGQPLEEVLRLQSTEGRPLPCPAQHTLRTGRSGTLEEGTLLRDRQGMEHRVADSCAPIRDASGAVRGAVLVLRDVTEALRTREEARQKDQVFRTLFEASPYAITIQEAKSGAFRLVNPAFERFTDIPAAEALGRTPLELGLVPSRETFERLALKASLPDNQETLVFRSRGREGHPGGERHGLLAMRSIPFEGRSCVLTMIVDISELTRLQEELSHAQRMDAIGQLAGGVAHDFNNMLGGILGAAEILRMDTAALGPLAKYADLIKETCERAAELNRKLLAFARKGRVESTPVDVHQAVENAVALLERTLDRRVTLETALEAERHTVVGDLSMLMNAFLNLGINAGHAMPEGGVLVFASRELVLDASRCRDGAFDLRPGPHLCVEVRDTGCGIPPEVRDRIFDPFFSTRSPGEGTGLGLAAVYGILRQHHGAIEVESTVGLGTTFRLYLPLAEVQPAGEMKEGQALRGTGRILLVDDEDIIRATARAMLERLGYAVTLATDGDEALAQYAKARPDLVILDMIMPRMGGRACFEAIRALDPDARVLIASGFSRESDMEALKTGGVKGFLRKPFNTHELSRAVAAAMT